MDPIEQYIRTAATDRGMDPDYAVGVYHGEGKSAYVGDDGSSFGPFQLHYGNIAPGGNSVSGLGDLFTKQTGLHASDPNTIKQQIDFSLDYAKQNGWDAWHGRPDAGALRSVNTSGNRQMDPGVLNSNYGLPPGVLGGDAASGIAPALQDAGAYLESINNPSALAGTEHTKNYINTKLAQLMAMKPEWTQVGQGLFGPKYGFVSPMAALAVSLNGGRGGPVNAVGQMTSVPGTAPASNGGGSSAEDMTPDEFSNLMTDFRSGKISKEDLMTKTGLLGQYAQSLADGTGDPRMLGNRAGELRPMAILMAKSINPNMPFDENAIAARQQYNRLAATGKSDPSTLPGAAVALGKLSEHALQTAQASEDLGGAQLFGGANATANEAQQWYKQHASTDQIYKGKLNALQTIAHTYGQEQDRLATGGHPTLTGAAASEAGLTSEKSHYERMRSLGESWDAAYAPLNQMVTNYNSIFGTNKSVEDFLSQDTKNNIAKLKDTISRSSQGVPGASGAPQAPISKTIGNTTYHQINGQWYSE